MIECCAALGSVTYAMKGRNLLSAAGIESRIIKLQASQTPRGCAYGLAFDCINKDSAASALRRGGVPYSDILRV